MRRPLVGIFIVLILSVACYGQILNYDVIDSIDYLPTCLTLADFDGDGLEEIFAGSDSGVVVIDPISHDILWYSNILPLPVSAIGYFDVDGDGFKDIVAGTISNGYWLNVIYGPDYSGLYTWGGYVNGVIDEIFNGILPDTANIIMITRLSEYRGIYLINTDTWDYTYLLRSDHGLRKAGSFLAEVITGRATHDYYYTFYGDVQFYNSSFISELFYRFRMFDTYNWILNFGIGTANGLFLVNDPAAYISAAYFEDEGIIFIAFDEDLNFTSEVVNPYTIQTLYFRKSHLFAVDDPYSIIDDILLINTYGSWETSIKTIYYDGHYLNDWGYLETDVPGFGNLCQGKIYSPQEDVFVSNGRYKIYTSRIYLTMVGTEEDEIIYPQSFMTLSVYPNPFNERANIALKLDESVMINISVYNVLGRKVDEIYNGLVPRGINRFSWNGNELSSGIYFITASNNDYVISSKAMLLR